MLKLQELLARGQGLHVEGVIGVLGGRAESLGKTNEKRGGGQKPCVRVGRPDGYLLEPTAWRKGSEASYGVWR